MAGGIGQAKSNSQSSGGVRVIPPGVDTTVFKPQDKELCRKDLDLPTDAFVIITGGASLTDTNKNVPWLLEQLSRLPDLAGVIVLVFGEGAVPVPVVRTCGLQVAFASDAIWRGYLQPRMFLSALR